MSVVQGPGLVTSLVFSSKDVAFSSKNGKMDIMDPQWPSRKAERLSGSGRGRLNSYSPSRQTRVSPCAPVLCPLGASSRVRRRSHTRRHGVRPQKWPEMLIVVCVLPDPDSVKTGIDAAAAEFFLSSSAAAGRGFLVFCASPFDVLYPPGVLLPRNAFSEWISLRDSRLFIIFGHYLSS